MHTCIHQFRSIVFSPPFSVWVNIVDASLPASNLACARENPAGLDITWRKIVTSSNRRTYTYMCIYIEQHSIIYSILPSIGNTRYIAIRCPIREPIRLYNGRKSWPIAGVPPRNPICLGFKGVLEAWLRSERRRWRGEEIRKLERSN